MQEYVLNLSISLRTGKETNLDFFSSSERTRKSSNGNLKLYKLTLKSFGKKSHIGGDSPRKSQRVGRVVLFGNAV